MSKYKIRITFSELRGFEEVMLLPKQGSYVVFPFVGGISEESKSKIKNFLIEQVKNAEFELIDETEELRTYYDEKEKEMQLINEKQWWQFWK